jgi:hypothetical protein
MFMSKVKYTKEVLEEAVAHSTSLAGVMRYLGKERYSGAVSNWIRGRLQLFGIDTSHFTGLRSALGKTSPKKHPPDEIFKMSRKTPPSHQLRRALLEIGVPDACSRCGVSEWLGEPLTLEVDHIDGSRKNNQKENLRFLCPNCHTQTVTYGNKKRPLGP